MVYIWIFRFFWIIRKGKGQNKLTFPPAGIRTPDFEQKHVHNREILVNPPTIWCQILGCLKKCITLKLISNVNLILFFSDKIWSGCVIVSLITIIPPIRWKKCRTNSKPCKKNSTAGNLMGFFWRETLFWIFYTYRLEHQKWHS